MKDGPAAEEPRKPAPGPATGKAGRQKRATVPADGIALYRIRGENALLLYIGVSDNFGRRWGEHARQQPWWGEMCSLSVDRWYPTRGEAEEAERAAIKAECPKYNKAHAVPVAVPRSGGSLGFHPGARNNAGFERKWVPGFPLCPEAFELLEQGRIRPAPRPARARRADSPAA